MTLESKIIWSNDVNPIAEIKEYKNGKLSKKRYIGFYRKEDVRLAVGELKELLRKKAFHSLTDDLYEPETIDDAFLYLPEIYKVIDEVLGFTTEGADKK
jgi:hypothetical protein